MIKSILTTTLVIFFANALVADHLIIPEAFNILKVNGKKNRTFLFSNSRKIKLNEGTYRIELQYVDYYDEGFDDFEKVVSQPFLISFNYQNQGQLSTDFKRPETIEAAKSFAENPSLKILVKADQKEIKQKKTKPETTANLPKVNKKEVIEKAESSPIKTNSLEQLRYWWKKASLEEKQSFMKEILQ